MCLKARPICDAILIYFPDGGSRAISAGIETVLSLGSIMTVSSTALWISTPTESWEDIVGIVALSEGNSVRTGFVVSTTSSSGL